jgi:hypothetical protein
MRLLWILLLVLAGSLTGYLITRFERSAPVIQTRVTPIFLGTERDHQFYVFDEGTGVERIRVWLRKDELAHELFDETYPGHVLTGATLKVQRRVEISLRPKELGLTDGPATLHIEARDYSWARNRSQAYIPLVIDSEAPRISLQTGLTYVRRGGAEAAVYKINEENVTHGVEFGDLFFPGFPHPGDPSRQVAFYVLPPNAEPGQKPQVTAIDRARNRSMVRVPIEIIERSFPSDRIELSEAFMEDKVNELLESARGDLLSSYLKINRDMRQENTEKIRQICQESSPDRLWSGPFLQLPNSKVGARYAEKRTYHFGGRTVDEQVHMGYDLASTAHAPVLAANDGVVVFADRLGIYGNTVILDHGLGVFSLYGHLSELAIEKGEAVSGGDRLGSTGTTGLAGGDHLHFAMLISGVFADPLEWFDGRWIREHIESKLSNMVLESG